MHYACTRGICVNYVAYFVDQIYKGKGKAISL
jgi:hypothetical protein